MKSKQKRGLEYQKVYDDNYSRIYNETFDSLASLLKIDDGVSAFIKHQEFRAEIVREYWNLFYVNPEDKNAVKDKFSERLKDAFRFREINYSRDHVELFFKNNLPKLVKEYNESYKSFEQSKVVNFDEKMMLLFLAKAMALKQFLDDTELFTQLNSEGILIEFEKIKNLNHSPYKESDETTTREDTNLSGQISNQSPTANPDNDSKDKWDGTFKGLFADSKYYETIVEMLKDNNYYSSELKKWIDRKNGWKGVFILTIKTLEANDYFKENVVLTPELIIRIALQDFKIKIGKSTVTHANKDVVGLPNEISIPTAPSIKTTKQN